MAVDTCFCGHTRIHHAAGQGKCNGTFTEHGETTKCGCLEFLLKSQPVDIPRKSATAYVRKPQPRVASEAFKEAGRHARPHAGEKEWQLIDNGAGMPKDLKGQQKMIWQIFKDNKWAAMTLEAITDIAVKDHGFKPNQDPQRAIYYYLNEWKKKGYIR